MNRAELQKLADERMQEAADLISASRWSGAYYLSGYSIECALKSCVLARIDQTGIIFQDKQFGARCWTHRIEELVELADLGVKRNIEIKKNPSLSTNWLLAKDWTVESRYRFWSEAQARELFDAIGDPKNGVLQWVKLHW